MGWSAGAGSRGGGGGRGGGMAAVAGTHCDINVPLYNIISLYIHCSGPSLYHIII